MSKAESIQKHKNMIMRHKDAFRAKREELSKDHFIDQYEKDLAKLFRKCASGEISFDEYEKKSLKIEEDRKARLIALGEDADAMNYKPVCAVCEDTGYIKGKVCKCLEKIIIDDMYVESGVAEILKEENFDTFSFDIFSDEKTDKLPRSPKAHIRLIHKRMKEYTENFNKETASLYFYGPVGAGKTFMSHCIAKDLIDKGVSVIFTTAYSLCKKLVDQQFGRIGYDEVSSYFDCDFLVIDELGQEGTSEYNRLQLYNIINERLVRGKKTLITSNFTIENLKSIYEERLVSRISSYEIIPFLPGDLRLRKRMMDRQK